MCRCLHNQCSWVGVNTETMECISVLLIRGIRCACSIKCTKARRDNDIVRIIVRRWPSWIALPCGQLQCFRVNTRWHCPTDDVGCFVSCAVCPICTAMSGFFSVKRCCFGNDFWNASIILHFAKVLVYFSNELLLILFSNNFRDICHLACLMTRLVRKCLIVVLWLLRSLKCVWYWLKDTRNIRLWLFHVTIFIETGSLGYVGARAAESASCLDEFANKWI